MKKNSRFLFGIILTLVAMQFILAQDEEETSAVDVVGTGSFGAATINGKIYNQISFRPELRYKKLGVGLDINFYIDENGEIYLINSHIPTYKESSYANHDPKRNRKLLLNKREINKLIGKINREGFTLIPTRLYFKKGKAKVEIAVAKGKRQYDKREAKKKRDWNKERARYFRKTS